MTRSTSESVANRSVADDGVMIRPRGRLLWWVVLLTVAGVAYATVVVWQRDTVRRQHALDSLSVFQTALRASLEAASGRLPLAMPATTPEGKALPSKGFTYLTAEAAQMLRDYRGPVLLGYGPRAPRGLRSGGNAALVYEDGKCTARWLTDVELNTWLTEQNRWVKEHRQELLERKPIVP